MSTTIKIPDTVYRKAKTIAKQKDMTLKEAIRHMCRTGGHDV